MEKEKYNKEVEDLIDRLILFLEDEEEGIIGSALSGMLAALIVLQEPEFEQEAISHLKKQIKKYRESGLEEIKARARREMH